MGASACAGCGLACRSVGRIRRGGREIDDRRVDAGFLFCYRCWPRRTQKESHRQRRREQRRRETSRRWASGGSSARAPTSVVSARGCCTPTTVGKGADDDGAMIRSIGSSGNAMRSQGRSTRRSRSCMGAIGAVGATGAMDAIRRGVERHLHPSHLPSRLPHPPTPRQSRALLGSQLGSAASARSKAAQRAAVLRFELLQVSADTRFPVAASKAIAPSEYTSDASPGDAYGGRAGSFAPMFDNAAAMPKPVMRTPSAASTMSRRCSKPWWTPRNGGVIDGASERFDERHDIAHRQRSTLAQHHVERIADGVFLREVRSAVLEPGRNRRGNVGMIDIRGDERLELCRRALPFVRESGRDERL